MSLPIGSGAGASLSSAGVCDVCGGSDSLGLGTCVPCAGPKPDSLLFLKAFPRRAERDVVEAWLVGTLGGVESRSDAREAAAGSRPLVGLSGAAAGRAATALMCRGFDAVVVPRHNAWRRLPRRMIALAGIVGGIGLFVGLTGTPALLVLGPLFSALLMLAASHELRLPVWRPGASPVLGLPDTVEPEVRATLVRLAPGLARRRLKDIARLAAALFDDGLPRTPALRTATEELLRLACGAVVDFDQLDRSLEVLERQPTDERPDDGLRDAVSAATDARDTLLRHLDAALAALVRARAAACEAPVELLRAAERLAEESHHRRRAWREVQRLTAWTGRASRA